MPALKIIGSVSTRPFASDDLHIPCFVLCIFRFVQVFCVAALTIFMYTQKVKGNENTLYWCGEEDSHPIEGLEGEQLDENDDFEEARPWMSAYLLLSLAVGFLDFTLLLAIWSAAGVGTPTQPMGRDKFLRPLLRTKIFVVTFLTLTLVIIGICMVHFFRQISWGCDPEFGPGEGFEATGLFTLFSVILVLQALEVFVLPAILVAKATGWIKRHDPVFQMKQETRVKSLDSCLTGCFKCCGFLCCKKTDMANTGELRDAADAALDFFGSTVNLTWSDLYFAIKLLARVQLERRIESIQLATSAQQSYNDDDKCVKTKTLLTGKMPIAPEKDEGALVEGDGSRRAGTRKSLSVRTFKRDDDTETMYNLITRYVLMPKTMKDITLVRDAIRHAKHSQAVYGDLFHVVEGYMKLGVDFVRTADAMLYTIDNIMDNVVDQRIVLDSIGFSRTTLAYCNFVNGINKTPYYISIDEEHSEVVISIRGSASLEDAVIDLQLTPSCMSDVGKRCGFDGEGEHCHKGVLTRCNWIYSDLEKHGILDILLSGNEPKYPDYQLIVTGHSLGAGCAAVLSCMLLNKFPNLKCHAFCPPGGLLSDKLSTHCEKFVTSFINNADIIPRMSLSNCEKLRDESLEVLARVKVSKMQLFRAFSYKVSDHQVPTLNKLLLCPAEETPKDTEFYQELHRFRDRLKSRNSVAKKRVPLYPPGRILYVIRRNEGHAGGEKSVCTPQWAEKTDFNEILLSSSFVEDHMLVSVIPNLELVLESLTNPEMSSYNDNEIIDSVFDKDFDEQEFELSERKFIFCSLPNGNVPFVAGILVFVAVFLAFVGNNHCAFVEQSTDWIDAEDGSVVLGTNQSVGLFRYEKKDYVVSGEISNPDSIASSGTCVPFPSWYPSDASLLGSRVLGFIGIASGCFSMLFLSLSLCAKCPRSIWRLITSLIAIAMVSQVLVFFLFLRCGVCTEFEYTEGDYHLFSASECELSSGAYFAIASMTLWFFAFVLTLRYPKPKF